MTQSELDSRADAETLRNLLRSAHLLDKQEAVEAARLEAQIEALSWPVRAALGWSDLYGDIMPPSAPLMDLLVKELAHVTFLAVPELKQEPLCFRWGTYEDRCILPEDHRGTCQTKNGDTVFTYASAILGREMKEYR